MANPVIRACVLHIKNKRTFTVNKAEVSLDGKRTPAYGTDQIVAYAIGIGNQGLTISDIVPIAGSDIVGNITEYIFTGGDVDIGYFAGGKWYRKMMSVMSCNISWNTETGMTEGSANLGSGLPTRS